MKGVPGPKCARVFMFALKEMRELLRLTGTLQNYEEGSVGMYTSRKTVLLRPPTRPPLPV